MKGYIKVVPCVTGEGNGTPLQYSCLENPTDRGAWKATVHGVPEGQTWLSDFTFSFHFHTLKKDMAPHSSVPAWRILGTGEPGGLPSTGSHRVRHDWSDCMQACIREGNVNPLQSSCLKDPRDRGPWWAAVYGVAQSQTRLKRLSSTIQSTNSTPRYLSKENENSSWKTDMHATVHSSIIYIGQI